MSYLGENIPKLGFGMMRLPMKGDQFDLEQIKDMVDYFMENGFTYFDTAFVYQDGMSEKMTKLALVDRYPREAFQLATKINAGSFVKDAEDAKSQFQISLDRTGAGYFDYYLLHNLGGERTQRYEEFGLWQFLQEQKQKGLIKHFGFSFHDNAEALEKLLIEHPESEFVQLQINYADWEHESIESRKCYEVARKYGKPIIIMEPVKGGALSTLSLDVAAPFHKIHPEASHASWAMRFSASLEGIITVLSGMSTLGQVKDNVSHMKPFIPLNKEELQAVEEVRDALSKVETIGCTSCLYCVKGCPKHIPIPGVFNSMNSYLAFHNIESAKRSYDSRTETLGKANECVACGRCEQVCPQHLHIIDLLGKTASIFDAN